MGGNIFYVHLSAFTTIVALLRESRQIPGVPKKMKRGQVVFSQKPAATLLRINVS
jgi:hypothetical protein